MRRRRGRRSGAAIWIAGALALAAASTASAGKYAVAQCGWHVGADADWADSTGGAKFRRNAYCVPPAGADPFDGVHLKSFTRDGSATVSGTRFARWRWVAPPGTGITKVQGTWWHVLHDGLEQRIGVGTAAGGFEPFRRAGSTDATPRNFVAGFATPMPALEDRLLCARGESKWCSLAAGSWSGLRALTITVRDDLAPSASLGGELAAAGWRRGVQAVAAHDTDAGAGVRFGETLLDGARVALTEYPCQKVSIGGEWRATAMRPCPTTSSAAQAVATTAFSDGPHSLQHCATDFAANRGCTAVQRVLVDNNPPAHPRSLAVDGGAGWHRAAGFRVTWANPGQGAASPIVGASWRLTGPAGFDGGVRFAAGRDRTALGEVGVPAPGAYALTLWLRDEAGNEDPATAVTVPLRFDDVPPGVAFAAEGGEGIPERLLASVADAHSGPAGGTISYRRLGAAAWTELRTRLEPGTEPGTARLSAATPGLTPGVYRFRVEAQDVAGNSAASTRRADGTEMALRKVAPVEAPRGKARLFARLRGGRGRGDSRTVPFGTPAVLGGRLVRADGAGVAGRMLRVVARPSRGALSPAAAATVATGRRGGFQLRLGPGPSRRLTVVFDGDRGLGPARRAGLGLRVRAGVTLRTTPRRLRTGGVVRLRGRVRSRGAAIPRRGKLVAIQYREAATGRWRPVLVTRSDHQGRFRARYRFRYVAGRASIRLRATALPEERWPYAPGSSPPVTVQVSGR
ncbi:MAG: fibronectin type III domain-containing protein [Solirubrobacterales bacterium]